MAIDTSKLVSTNPNDFVSAGLARDFDGVIVKSRYMLAGPGVETELPYTPDKLTLVLGVTIKPDEESGYDEFTQYYSHGSGDDFKPTEDGDEPAEEGRYTMPTGQRKAPNNGTNAADFLSKLIDAGFPSEELSFDISAIEGARGYFTRVPQRKRSGLVTRESDRGPAEILIMTEYKGRESAGGKKTGAGSKKGAGSASGSKANGSTESADSAGGDEFSGTLAAAVLGVLSEAGGDSMPRAKVVAEVSKTLPAGEKAKGIKTMTEAWFQQDDQPWQYDVNKSSVSL